MTKEKRFLLDVLKAFIHNEKLNFDTKLEWNELIRLARINSVSGILSYIAMQNPCERTAPLADSVKRSCFINVALFTRRYERTQQMLARLSDAGIDNMPFKGSIVRRYYPVPELRSFGDADILIKREDRERCHKLMFEQGFTVVTDWEPVYSYKKGIEYYELHTEMLEIDISDKADCKSYFNTAWEHADKMGEHSFEPQPEFHFLYLLTHIAKHIRGSGAGIRMYLDLAVFIKHFGDGIDWQYVNEQLEALKLKQFANTALTVVERYFGVQSPIDLEPISEESLKNFMDFTFDGGLFGYVGRDSGVITLKKADDGARVATILRRLFPTADTIERRYTYLQGRHWLLPVAWAHRFFKTHDTWGAHAKEAKSIINADAAKVEELKKIYEDLCL